MSARTRIAESATAINRPRVEVPRWFLCLLYAEFLVLGIVAATRGVPTLDLTTFQGYTLFWGIGVTLSAGASAVLACRRRWEPWERWTSLVLAGLILGYAFGSFSLLQSASHAEASARIAFSIVLIIIGTIILGRALQLLFRVGGKR